MQLFVFAVVFCLVASGYASPCSDLSGNWRNNLGSNMTIVPIADSNKITGYYNTSVESTRGAASFSSKIAGTVHITEEGSLVAFNVLWNHGASITAWVGQCLLCDGRETIYTTWVLRSLQTPRNRWMSTRINEDTFWRVDDIPISDGQPAHELPVAEQVNPDSDLLGQWISVTGDSLAITQVGDASSFEGLHTAPESLNGTTVFGRFDGNATYTALGFSTTKENSIKGWAGHIYNPQDATKNLETSWLSYTASNNCNNPRKYVNYGMDHFSKTA